MKLLKKTVSIIAITLFMLTSYNGNAQSIESKTKIFCVTTSCCGFGFFSIEIWSETICHYVEVQKTSKGSFNYSMKFKTNEKGLKRMSVKEDLLLAGLTSEKGESLYLPMGNYDVIGNEIFFTPKVVDSSFRKARYCYIREVSGTLFGHDYQYSIEICISFGRDSKGGTVSINPKLTSLELSKLSQLNNEIEFTKDININEDGLNYTLKAGKYIVNSDGYIYQQGTKIK